MNMTVSSTQLRFGELGRIIKNKLKNDNDAKVIIQAENSQTGVGKTTLAIHLCRFVNSNWDPQENGAYWNVNKYVNDYNDGEIPKGSAVLLDEIEMLADSRRSMSHQNLRLSQAWARLRNRNVMNVVTLPTVSMLDKRMLELADFWILVRERGVAQPYSIEINDFTYKIRRKAFPGNEHITFKKIPKSDPDYQYIEDMKAKVGNDDFETITMEEHRKIIEKLDERREMDERNDAIHYLVKDEGVSHSTVADLFGLSQPRVTQIVNDY